MAEVDGGGEPLAAFVVQFGRSILLIGTNLEKESADSEKRVIWLIEGLLMLVNSDVLGKTGSDSHY